MTCLRNNVQGCCPIKVIEGMAAGTPLIASNLPVVQELGIPGEHYIPARPGDAGNLKNLILESAAGHTTNHQMAIAARKHVEQNLTWRHATEAVGKVYHELFVEGPSRTTIR